MKFMGYRFILQVWKCKKGSGGETLVYINDDIFIR